MRRLLIGTSLVIALGSGAALAQDAPAKAGKKVYVGAQAGIVLPEDVNFSSTGSGTGFTTSTSGSLQFKEGYSVSGIAGYHINDYIRAEGELGYSRFDYDSVSLNGTLTSGGTTYAVAGTTSLDGHVSSVSGLAHAIVSPLGKAKVMPVVGAGIGVASTSEKITRVGTVAVNSENDHTDLALAGTVGVETDLGDSATVGVRYRYLWINSGTDGRDDFTAHNFVANAALKF